MVEAEGWTNSFFLVYYTNPGRCTYDFCVLKFGQRIDETSFSKDSVMKTFLHLPGANISIYIVILMVKAFK